MSLDAKPREGLAAAALLAGEVVVRGVVGHPYPGSMALVLAACGIALLPLLPAELGTPSLRLATAPAVGLGSFAIALTTVSIVGIPLTEVSVRLAAAGLIVLPATLVQLLRTGEPQPGRSPWSARREGVAVAVLLGVFAFSFAASWDVVDPFPPRGTDWGHYLLFAEEVESQQRVLAEDRLSGEEDRLFADPPAIGALYGGSLVLDGISSRSLGAGIVLASALVPLSVYALVGALWGVGAGLLAAGAYAVSPIHLEPMYWYGLATTLALLFLPIVLLALGLLFRRAPDGRSIALLGLGLVAVAAAHPTSAVVVAALLGIVVAVDLVRWVVVARGRPRSALATWWREGLIRPVLYGVAVAVAAGAGVLAHLRVQSNDLGSPVSYRFFEPDWLDLDAVGFYFSWAFLAVAAASIVLVLSDRRLRRDPALLAVVALALASVVVSQLWRVEFPFEYRRAVYYFGLALAVVIGVASLRFTRVAWWVVAYGLVLVYIAHVSVGFRLPQRLLSGPDERSGAVSGLVEFRELLERGAVPETKLVVADRCLHFIVPYLVRRPTLAAFEEWQVGFTSRLPLARTAAQILTGGDEGRRLAGALGVGYAVADPSCTPDLARRLGGLAVVENKDLTVIRLPPTDVS